MSPFERTGKDFFSYGHRKVIVGSIGFDPDGVSLRLIPFLPSQELSLVDSISLSPADVFLVKPFKTIRSDNGQRIALSYVFFSDNIGQPTLEKVTRILNLLREAGRSSRRSKDKISFGDRTLSIESGQEHKESRRSRRIDVSRYGDANECSCNCGDCSDSSYCGQSCECSCECECYCECYGECTDCSCTCEDQECWQLDCQPDEELECSDEGEGGGSTSNQCGS